MSEIYRRFELYTTASGGCPVAEYLDDLSWRLDRQAVQETLAVVQQMKVPPSRVFKKLKGRDGLWEVRVFGDRKDYRVLCASLGAGLYLAVHIFAKKSQATPEAEIDVARRRAKEYSMRRSQR